MFSAPSGYAFRNVRKAALVLFISLYGGLFCAQAQQAIQNGDSRSAAVRGQVLTPGGQAVPNVRVELRPLTRGAWSTALTGADGSFEFTDLLAADYQIVAISGMIETSENVHASDNGSELTLHISTATVGERASAIVSVTDLKIPARARKLCDKAAKSLNKGDFAAASKEVESALDVEPRFAAALTLRGLLRMCSRQHADARKDFASAIDIDHGYSLAYAGLASDYNFTGEFDAALKTVEDSKAHAQQSWQLHLEASRACLGKKLSARALAEANQAESLFGRTFPTLSDIRAKAYLQLQQNDSAAHELRQYLAYQPVGAQADEARRLLATLEK
jgi:tetratricopeptide (TPR) repeat protein